MGADLEGVADLTSTVDEIERRWSGNVTYAIGSNLDYAAAVEYGTDPHPITPDDADVLRFEIGGTTVFTKHVEHPGTEGQPYLRPAIDAAGNNLGTIASDATTLEQVTRRIAEDVESRATRKAPVDDGTLRASIHYYPLNNS